MPTQPFTLRMDNLVDDDSDSDGYYEIIILQEFVNEKTGEELSITFNSNSLTIKKSAVKKGRENVSNSHKE